MTIEQMAFHPARLAASPGDTIVWDNHDIVPHTATSIAGAWNTGNIGPDSSGRVVLPARGLGAYRCTYHPTMMADVTQR